MIKKVALILQILLTVSTVLADLYSKEEKTTDFVVTPSIAYRYDVFKWSIPMIRLPENKLSELIWHNHIIQAGIKFEKNPQTNQFTFLGKVKYGYIAKHPSMSWDLDWDSLNPAVIKSKTKSSVEGNILDLSGAIGYSVNLFKNNLLSFYVGYDYSDYKNRQYGVRQLLHDRDLEFPSDKLISKYYFKTNAPWIGLSLQTPLNERFTITPTIKVYSFNYIGKGYWLLIDHFEPNPSFKHNAKGRGLEFDMGFLYKYSDNVDYIINIMTKKFLMKSGREKVYFSEQAKKYFPSALDTNKLYNLSLVSSSISIGLRYKL